MVIVELKKEAGRLVPIRTTMENLKRGTRTEILVEDYRVDVPESELPDEMFTPDFLQSEG